MERQWYELAPPSTHGQPMEECVQMKEEGEEETTPVRKKRKWC